jgi:hypothetical protein
VILSKTQTEKSLFPANFRFFIKNVLSVEGTLTLGQVSDMITNGSKVFCEGNRGSPPMTCMQWASLRHLGLLVVQDE